MEFLFLFFVFRCENNHLRLGLDGENGLRARKNRKKGGADPEVGFLVRFVEGPGVRIVRRGLRMANSGSARISPISFPGSGAP